MKLMHTTTTTLNTKEFNNLSDRIIDSLFVLNPDIKKLYDIHINFIKDSWQIDFLPLVRGIPAIKAEGYTEYNNRNIEILRIKPKDLTDFSKNLKLGDDNKAYDRCLNFVTIFEFVLSLYDFEYKL